MTSSKYLMEAWKAKSASDLLTCKRLLTFEEPTIDTILFHAQQAVEKALNLDPASVRTHIAQPLDSSSISKKHSSPIR